MTSHVTGHLTVAEAVAETGASESTIRRRLREKAFPGATRESGGGWRVPRKDLVAAGLLTGTPEAGETVESPVVDVRDDVVDLTLVERAVRAEARVEVLDGLAEEVARLRRENADLRERAGRAEATVDTLRSTNDNLLRMLTSRAIETGPEVDVEDAVVDEDQHEDAVVDEDQHEDAVVDEDQHEDAVVDEDQDAHEEAGKRPVETAPPAAPVVEDPVEPRRGAWSALRAWFRG